MHPADRVRIAVQGILRIQLGEYLPEYHEKGGAEVGTETRNHASGTKALRPGVARRLRFADGPIETWSFRDEDMSGKEIGVSQMFPYPGKRKLKTDMAVREREQAGYDLEGMRSMLRSEGKKNHAELAAVRRQG